VRSTAGTDRGERTVSSVLGTFLAHLTNSEVIAAFGDDDTALLMYDAHSTLVASALTAEWFAITEGKISQSRIIFDRVPFDAARTAAG